MQWGTYTIKANATITLPTSFSNTTWVGVVTYISSNNIGDAAIRNIAIWDKTTSTCVIRGMEGNATKSIICVGF